ASRSRLTGGAGGIARPFFGRASLGDQARDLAATFEARIDETRGFKPCQRHAVRIELRALAQDRPLPRDAEPRQILVNRLLVFRPAARRTGILDSPYDPAACPARHA